MAQHRKSKKRKRMRKPPTKDMIIRPGDIKVRKRIAPSVRVFLSDKDKESKHKQDFLKDLEDDA